MVEFMMICVAGGVGSGLRHLLTRWLVYNASWSVPMGTLGVNTIGSFLIGVIIPISLTTTYISPSLRIILSAGFLGGFTTYSSFNYETIRFFSEGDWAKGFSHIVLMTLSCLFAGGLGFWLAKRLLGH